MIKIDNVTMYYDRIKSLDNVNAFIGRGSIFGLIGSNGSGKSTLLRIMAGIFRPESGAVYYDYEEKEVPELMPVYENTELKQDVVYISDEQYFIPNGTLETMADFYSGVYENFDKSKYYRLAKLFRLETWRKINTFSKGMKKQAAIILALAVKPKFLLCDETFDGLDPVMRRLAKQLLSDAVVEYRMTPVIASHNLREIEDICDHIGLLHEGSILFEKDIDDMKLGIHKLQIVFKSPEDAEKFCASVKTVSKSQRGSVYTIAARGEKQEISDAVAAFDPVFYEIIPLSLEEIFICEMEDRGYDSSEILL